ncbi:MAG: hypothetical protein E7089_09615 [Bacteroidales bacterium]|nr:hypothetical protein [Bacteroidales bacterium]
MKKQLLFIFSLLLTLTVNGQKRPDWKDPTEYVWWVRPDSMHLKVLPQNPALKMTQEERTAKYNEMKAKDSFKLGEDGNVVKIHKTLPNLVTIDAEVINKNQCKMTFTGIDGTVINSTRSLKNLYLKNLYTRCEYFTGDYGGSAKYDSSFNYIDMLSERDTCYVPNKFELIFENSITVYDQEKKGDYIIYYYNSGWEKPWDIGNLDKHDSNKGLYLPIAIRKTYEDCILSYKYEEEYKVQYNNGDVYYGTMTPINDSIHTSIDYLGHKIFNVDKFIKNVVNSKQLSELAMKFKDGKLKDSNGNVKVYTDGEYDEIESAMYTEREKARIKAEKEKEEAFQKEITRLKNTYGEKWVNIFINALGTRFYEDALVVGMPIGLLKYMDKLDIVFMLKEKYTDGNNLTYDVYVKNYKRPTAYITIRNGKIISVYNYK